VEIPLFDEYKLRSFKNGDEASIVKYANNKKIWLNVRDSFPFPYTMRDARDWIRECRDKPETVFAVTTPTEAIGAIGFHVQSDVYRKSAEVGYWLGEPFWNKGILTAALGALVSYAFANFDIMRIYATVFDWNPASARVLTKNGFKLEGRLVKNIIKDGKIIDSLLYALVRVPAK
jgi:[ribosomal protein S5]-alanine N-acetyltransferase